MTESLACVEAPALHAAHILKAWARGDETALRKEFERALDLDSSNDKLCMVEEQTELLKTVVARLNSCPDVLNEEHGDPVRRICLNLLIHLAV